MKIKLFIYSYVIPAFYSLGYPFKRKRLNYQILSTLNTIDYIITNHVSVSRYGDGEYDLVGRKGNGFQNDSENLSIKLTSILSNPIPGHLICIPLALKTVKGLRLRSKLFWMSFVSRRSELVASCTNNNIVYGNSLFSRFYIIMDDRNNSSIVADKVKQIWEGRNVCIVEGENTKLGVGNDLLSGAKSIKRILCPSKNAFDKYDQIRAAVNNNVTKDTLILCALGMTATALSYDLTKDGYQAIDIGHIDLEYMWMKMGANTQCAIPGKYVNEVPFGDVVEQVDNISNQVLCRVL